ncbi:MAG: beta-class carbonic anhydrase [Thomasclavelia ramosa]
MIDEILAYNRAFVTNKGYKPYTTSKYPDRKLAIVTCMDTRLIELLPAALGIKNGDAKIIKNAGGVIVHPFGSAVRSLLIAIYELNVEEIMIIGHTDCGVGSIDIEAMLKKMEKRGISETVIRDLGYCGIDLINGWAVLMMLRYLLKKVLVC